MRGSVRNVFTPNFIAGLHDGIATIAADTIDSIAARVEFDFTTDVALPLRIAVAAAWMGLDTDAVRLLRDESPAITRMLNDPHNTIAVDNGAEALATLLTEFLPLAADRRHHPRDELLSFIATDTDLELDDVVTTAVIIAIAGHQTIANLLGAAMIRLLTPERHGTRPIDAIDDRLVTELQCEGRTEVDWRGRDEVGIPDYSNHITDVRSVGPIVTAVVILTTSDDHSQLPFERALAVAYNCIIDVEVTDFARAHDEVATAGHARDVAELMIGKAGA